MRAGPAPDAGRALGGGGPMRAGAPPGDAGLAAAGGGPTRAGPPAGEDAGRAPGGGGPSRAGPPADDGRGAGGAATRAGSPAEAGPGADAVSPAAVEGEGLVGAAAFGAAALGAAVGAGFGFGAGGGGGVKASSGTVGIPVAAAVGDACGADGFIRFSARRSTQASPRTPATRPAGSAKAAPMIRSRSSTGNQARRAPIRGSRGNHHVREQVGEYTNVGRRRSSPKASRRRFRCAAASFLLEHAESWR